MGMQRKEWEIHSTEVTGFHSWAMRDEMHLSVKEAKKSLYTEGITSIKAQSYGEGWLSNSEKVIGAIAEARNR